MQIVKEIVFTGLRLPYSSITREQANWIVGQWLILFDEIKTNPSILYRGLVLANRDRPIGKLALVFNSHLYSSGMKGDRDLLRKILFDVPFPEGESNPYLSSGESQNITNYLKHEMLTINHLINLETMKSGIIPTKIINSSIHGESQRDVCLSPIGYSTTVNELEFGIASVNMVQVPDRPASLMATVVGCFNLLDLLDLLLSNKINPYTGFPFSIETRDKLSRRFEIHLKMFHFGQELIR
jgi:hypothetical protein